MTTKEDAENISILLFFLSIRHLSETHFDRLDNKIEMPKEVYFLKKKCILS